MIIWRKGKGGAGMPLHLGYLGKLPVFHIFWNSYSHDENEKYRLDVSLPYTKDRRLFATEEGAKRHASILLAQWLIATGLKEDEE